MKRIISQEGILNNFKIMVFKNKDTSKENVEGLFKLAKELNDIETIKILAKEYFFLKAILFLEDPNNCIKNADLNKLIFQQAGYNVIKKAIEKGAYIHQKDTNGNTPIIMASIFNQIDIVKLLLQHGASSNDRINHSTRLVESIFALGYKELLELLVKHDADDILDEYAMNFFYKVDEKISTQFIAKQFIYEELDAAHKGNEEAQHFVDTSGIKEKDYLGAMNKSLPEVDGRGSPQQVLLFQCLMPLMNENNRDITTKIRILTVEKIMSKYRIGKYKNKITKLTLEDNSMLYIHSDHAIIDEERFELIENRKYYNTVRKLYLEWMINNAVVFYCASYEEYEPKKEYFSIINEEEILKYDVKHNPKRLIEILNYFTKDNPIKYTVHSFDWNKYGTYENFMKEVKKTFELIDEDLKYLSPNLYEKISKFLFSNRLNENNTWGMNHIGFGWSSPELRKWSNNQELNTDGKKAIYFPLPDAHIKLLNGKTISNFDDVCNVFKNEIEIRDDGKLSILLENLEEEILGFDFEIKYINLENISFYTDAEYLRFGLIKIFEQFKENDRKMYNSIVIEALPSNNRKYIDLLITQVDSESTKNPIEMMNEIKDGDFQDIKNYFISICDWSVIFKYQNQFSKIDYLSVDTENVVVTSLSTGSNGFTHKLRFYND